MADVFWRGGQVQRADVKTLTVGTASTGGTITVTVGGTKSVVVTPSTTNTTTTATEIQEACSASTEPEFTELTFTSALAVVTITGPADGAPITVAKTDGGSNSTTLAAATAPLSPNDIADAANYVGAATPANGDRLVLQDSDVPLKYNLDGLTSITFTILRKSTFTAAVGLPDLNQNGYPEYRPTFLETAGVTLTVEGSSSDSAQQFRVKFTGAAVTVTYTGGSPTQIGGEVVEIHGTPAASIYYVAGGSLAVAPKVGQTATVGTLVASNASLRIGSGVTLGSVAGPSLQNVTASILCSWSNTLTLDGGDVSVGGAAAGVFTLDGGRLTWRSTGNPGNSPIVGSGASLDLTQAPKVLTIGGTVALYAGGTLDDGAGRGGNYALQTVRCTLQEVNWITPNSKTYTLS